MAVVVTTSKPRGLMKRLVERISAEEIRTWELDEEGDLTHSATQWVRRAWMRARFEEPGLIFTIIPPKGQAISTAVYAVYHGRLVEMLLAHADDLMTSVEVTPYPEHGDNVRP